MNYELFQAINGPAGRWPAVDHVMQFAATYLIFGVFAVAAVVAGRALLQRRIRPVAGLGVTLGLAFGLAQLLAHASREMRPFQDHAVHQLIPHAPGVSLPSDHATAAFTLAFGVWLFLDRRAGMALTAAAALIGLARVWCGVHYPGDILAAAVIAGLAALMVYVTDRGAREAASYGASESVGQGVPRSSE
ncbi:phosphatase PAP2 family protein [Paractinoplanes durhamensis]|uniref:Undecaprenyl-diphosphatase BcrC n=1 Tax=Paractinoplanes durhamensis TaxID=113563 RepID=A0ABQ3YU21_9ACTN|nr:phosphatase PAP2 family protein [Actinoplanes durhamensis]GIE01115.1 undecaprenyl-diphosphatase BcrC [Actinoplanes durhamensis]